MHCLFLCIGGGFFDMDILDSVIAEPAIHMND